MLAGGLELVGLLALLIGVCELIERLLPRRALGGFAIQPTGQSCDEMQEIVGDVAGPCPDPVSAARNRGAL